MKTMIINEPVPFAGTDAEREANRSTHTFDYGDDTRCINCGCKAWHTTADYACGADVPRQNREVKY